jgi:hypothetical protein
MGSRIQSLLEKDPDLPKHRFASAFTCPRGNAGSSLRGNSPASKTHWQIREFLGDASFCQIWIPNYSLLATKGREQELLVQGGEEQEKAFKEIKRAFTNAPALGLLNVMKSFFLYVHEQKGTAVGGLTCQNNSMLFSKAGHLACMP